MNSNIAIWQKSYRVVYDMEQFPIQGPFPTEWQVISNSLLTTFIFYKWYKVGRRTIVRASKTQITDRRGLRLCSIYLFIQFENKKQHFKLQNKHHRLTCYNVNLGMFQKSCLPFESCITLVALERSQSIVISHVPLQLTWRSASIIALVAFVRFFSCMIPHHVFF